MKKKFSLVLFVLALGLIALFAMPVQAATKKQLKVGTTYKLDLDGDGKKESFEITYESRDNRADFYFVHKGVKDNVFFGRTVVATYYRYSKKNAYIFLERYYASRGSDMAIYRYTKNGLQLVQDPIDFDCESVSFESFLKKSGKNIYFTGRPYWAYGIASLEEGSMSYGSYEFVAHYKLDTKTHTFKLVSKTLTPKKKYKVVYTGSKYRTSTKITKDNKKGIWLKPGKSYTIKGYRVVKTSSGTLYRLKVANSSGKTGWFTSSSALSFKAK